MQWHLLLYCSWLRIVFYAAHGPNIVLFGTLVLTEDTKEGMVSLFLRAVISKTTNADTEELLYIQRTGLISDDDDQSTKVDSANRK